jgi:hypothetical protein
MRQQALAMTAGFEWYTKKTRRAQFLEEMEQVMPRRELTALIEPYYPKAGNGRPPVGMERMLRIYVQQQWFRVCGTELHSGRKLPSACNTPRAPLGTGFPLGGPRGGPQFKLHHEVWGIFGGNRRACLILHSCRGNGPHVSSAPQA